MLTDRFDAKHPTALDVLSFDMSLQLGAGETLTGTPTVAIEVRYGADIAPGNVLNGAANIDSAGKVILVPVKAGTDQCDYLITVSCASTNPQKSPAMNAILPVRIT